MSAAATLPETAPITPPPRLVLPAVEELLLWAIVILSPLQDTILQNTPLKLLAASPAALGVLLLALLAMARRILRPGLSVNRALLIGFAYVAVVSAAHLITFQPGLDTVQWRPLRTYSLMTALFLFMLMGVGYRSTRGLRIAIYLSFVVTLIGVLVGGVLGPNAITVLQFTPNVSGRPHGFSTEAGTLSVQIVCIGMLVSHYVRRGWAKLLTGAMTCALLIYSQSKGGLIVLLVCTLIVALVRSRASLTSKLLVALLVSPAIVVGVLFVSSMFSSVIELNQTSTIATRVSMVVFSLITVLHNPFGVGFTGFLPSLPKYLPQAMWTVQSWFPMPLAFVEVKEYLAPPFQDADCKTLFFDFFTFFGIPFAAIFFRFTVRLLRGLLRTGCFALFVGVLFSVAAMLTYYSTLNAYTVPLLIGIALHEVRQREAALCLH